MLGRRLLATTTNQTADLQRAIRRVSGMSTGTGASEPRSSAAVRIGRDNGRSPYHVVVVPLPRRCQPRDAAGAVAVLFITDPDRGQAPADLLCGDLYGLTAAEVRLVSALLEHSGLTAAAKALGVSRNTAHSQLASVFQKTGTRSQSELLRLILGSIAPVETPDSTSGFHPAFEDPDISRA
jgi:DNA-binding CsgD family transcriptional regulator